MSLILNFIDVIISAAVVLITAIYAVKSSVKIAKHFRLSDELIGMTILAVGTSIPEIMTHVIGSVKILNEPSLLNQISGLVVGTNIGSDIFQQNFLIGLIALVGIIIVDRKHLLTGMGGLIVAAVILLVMSTNGFISRIEGIFLVILYIIYVYYLHKHGMVEKEETKLIARKNHHPFKNSLIVIISFIIMAFAAERMLQYSTVLVKALPISASFFGVILLGIAAAFPELMTSLIAIHKKKAKISAGILIGSNVTNPMFALGLGAIISTYTIPSVVIWFDLPIKILTALLLLVFLMRGKLQKKNALVLIIFYIVYLIFRSLTFPTDVVF